MMTGVVLRFGGSVLTGAGALIFAITQTIAEATPTSTPDHTHRGLVTGAVGLAVIGVVVLALGVIRGWFVGALIYVHGRPVRENGEDERAEDVPVKQRRGYANGYTDALADAADRGVRPLRLHRKDDHS